MNVAVEFVLREGFSRHVCALVRTVLYRSNASALSTDYGKFSFLFLPFRPLFRKSLQAHYCACQVPEPYLSVWQLCLRRRIAYRADTANSI
jgi:hypothetical protein